jgi:general secretion pathway protein B
MSSILEALKKLEDEKTARLSGAGNIAGKVVKAGRRPRQRPWWLVPAGMAAVAASAVLVTYLLMSGFSTRNETARTPAVSPPLQPQQAAAPAAALAPPPLPSPAVADKEIFPEKGGRTASPALPSAALSARQVSPPVATPHQQTETRKVEEPVALPPQVTKPGVSDIPALNVSGIAWQKGGAERFAMINGKPVAEGATVDGARVEEIFPDRVRFSFANRTFEVSLGKTSGAAP